jgi:hypothetical protein
VLKATSGKVVAKLCMDVVQKCETTLSLLKPLATAYERFPLLLFPFFDETKAGLLTVTTYTTVTMDVFKAIEALEFVNVQYVFLSSFSSSFAEVSYSNYGATIGYLRVAVSTFPEGKSKVDF